MIAIDVAAGVLAERVGDRLRRDEPVGPRTTYRVGGRAALFLDAATVDDLMAARAAVAASGVPVLVVGKGSNLLVTDDGFPGLAVALGETFAEVTVAATTVRAGAAAALPVVARRTVAAGLTGFEWAVGVPGSIGGAVRMNAGGHGSDMAASLVSIRALDLAGGEDGGVRDVAVAALALGYRRSAITTTTVVLDATLALATGDRPAGEAELATIVRWRRAHQPGGQNAGSVFTNPPDDSAGRLVEAAGWRGRRLGTAQVADKHANFILADPDGRADDVVALMGAVRAAVRAHSGVDLHPETIISGHHPELEVES
ncbi:MAG: UDP-N-acetylmuramate dehydrogenase [Acidimicrobiales bacterium]